MVLCSDLRSVSPFADVFRFGFLNPALSDFTLRPSRVSTRQFPLRAGAFRVVAEKPSGCTADELHYVAVPNSDWRLALWRYKPSPKGPSRKHPLLLLSGVGTNAIGYDLAPESSFARYMSRQGLDTWILEVRGAGLSTLGLEFNDVEKPVKNAHGQADSLVEPRINGVLSSESEQTTNPCASSASEISSSKSDESELSKFIETFVLSSERFLEEGPLDARQRSTIMKQIKNISQRLLDIIEEGQRSVSPQFFNVRELVSARLDDFQKQLDQLNKYDWDFDHYLEEDLPAVMEYIKKQCKPKDGKLFAIGHSMGGILLYAMLSRYGFEGKSCGLASIVTLGSSLDYTSSRSSFKLLLPLADPVQALNVPAIPLEILFTAVHPFASQPPYILSWLNPLISAQMHPKLLEKLVLKNFCTVPVKLLLQLATAFHDGGLCNRNGTFFYKDHLRRSNVPILALAGDQDLICPPEAVYETAKLIPRGLVTYRVFGEPGGPHYGHYDLVGGCMAVDQVYPCIIEFLSRHDAC